MFTFTFQAEDYFSKFTGLQGNDILVPKGTISAADFLDCPTDAIGKPIPIVYGDRSKTASSTAPPQWVSDPNFDFTTDGVYWQAGRGNRVSLATPPTSLTPVDGGAGGSLNLGDQPGNYYYFMVTAIGSDGIESDPYPFKQSAAVQFTLTSSGRKISVSWSGGSGAVTYRCYVGIIYFGIRWCQYIQTASTSCVFDAMPPFGTTTNPSNISTGASNALNSMIWWYAVSALMPDGETPLSKEAVFTDVFGSPTNRPAYLKWQAVAGATGYRLYKRGTTGGYKWRFDLPAGSTTFTDDHSMATAAAISGVPKQQGPIPATYVGTVLDSSGFSWRRFVVCQHAVKAIVTVYQGGEAVDPGNYGVTFAVPGKTNYNLYFGANPYTDINGKRFTCIMVRGPQGDAAADGSKPLWVGLQGIETNADSTGTLITDLSDQYLHFFRNYVLRDGTGTSWATTGPTWGDSPVDVDIVDATSFADVKARWALRLPGVGCPGAWTVGVDEGGALKQEGVRTWIARLNQSLDVRSGFSRKSQYVLSMFWRDISEIATASSYTASLGINKDTFKITDRPEKVENKITARYNLQPGADEPWTSTTTQDVDSQNALAGEVKPRTLDLWCTSNAAVAWAIIDARLKRRRFPTREAEWESDMGALTDDLGTLATVTHPDGYGAQGWVAQPTIITRHEFDPQGLKVRITAEDVYWIFDASISATQPLPQVQANDDPALADRTALEALLVDPIAANPYFVHDPGDDFVPTPLLSPDDAPPELVTSLARDEMVED